MKPRPTIFLSGVSSEFASFREAVEVEIQKKGCFVENQSSFATDYRTIEAMLRQKLSEADAMIHIVGFRYGAEPKQRPADKPRRSYTQMEFDIARHLQKPVYVFLSQDAAVTDPTKPEEQPEDPEAAARQLTHREAVQKTDYLYYVFKDKDDLCRRAAAIQTVTAVEFRADISRIDRYAPAELIGRDKELAFLNDAWLKIQRAETPRAHVLTFVGLGGEGKTSLVAKWAADLAHQGWPSCDAAFAWSFYSQGTREQFAAPSDLFLKEAITFFGDETDKEFAASSAGAYEKCQRLARLVGQRHSLLILDGLEPLQYAPTSPTAGQLKDPGLAALIRRLAANSLGLCIITSRYSVTDLKTYWQTTAPEVPLLRLSRTAGVNLLHSLGVKGSFIRNISFNNDKELLNEFEKLVEDVKGHAFTLNLLGTFLRDAHNSDIRRRDLIRLEEADTEEQSGHAFRVVEAYERALKKEGQKGKRALAILRLFGLFDRPVPVEHLNVLMKEPPIAGLNDQLIGLTEAQRNFALKRLENAKLLTVYHEESGALVLLDAHPLLREYFDQQLRIHQLKAWRTAHFRLYKHLCTTTPQKEEPTLEDLQPLYEAVAHGCKAERHLEVCNELYDRLLLREDKNYTVRKLGAFASDLEAVTGFFDNPWIRVLSVFPPSDQAWLLNVASFCLQSLGRFLEAVEPMRVGLNICIKHNDWRLAAIHTGNLSLLELALGKVGEAVRNSEECLFYADNSGDQFQRIQTYCIRGHILNQAGYRIDADVSFREAEQIQTRRQPQLPLLHGINGFLYWDLLLIDCEAAAWRRTLRGGFSPICGDELTTARANAKLEGLYKLGQTSDVSWQLQAIRGISGRASQTLKWAAVCFNVPVLDIALTHLALGRAALYQALLSETASLPIENAELKTVLANAINGLRQAGQQQYLPSGLLTRAWERFLGGVQTASESAQEDLEEAWEIAERGPMRLHMADIHLYRARLFFREKEYPWESARADLEAAERLINECGYHRRDEELADAKRVILGI
jgi:hypothetical protein